MGRHLCTKRLKRRQKWVTVALTPSGHSLRLIPRRDVNVSVNMADFGDVPAGDYDICLKINDPKEASRNKRSIQFANHNIWNASLGANLIGSTTVEP
jgi:hypothetical protein